MTMLMILPIHHRGLHPPIQLVLDCNSAVLTTKRSKVQLIRTCNSCQELVNSADQLAHRSNPVPDLLFLEIARKPEQPPGSARASLGGLGWVSRCAFWRLWRCKFRQSRDRETAHLSSDRDRGATAPSSRPRRCSVRPPLQFPRHRAVVTSTLRRVHSSRPVAPVVLVQRHQPATHHPARPAAPRRAPLPSARPPVSPSPRRLVNATARG